MPLDPAIQLRPFCQEDLGKVRQLREEMSAAHSQSSFWPGLEPDTLAWVAVTADDCCVGYAELRPRISGQVTPNVWVQPAYQGHGIGLALLREAETQARLCSTSQSASLLAQLQGENPAACCLLEKAGYTLSSTFWIMELQLIQAPEAPAATPGIAVKPFAVGQDERGVYEADEEAFLDERGKLPRTYAEWGRRLNMHSEHFDPLSGWLPGMARLLPDLPSIKSFMARAR
ncbi:N-acetyltransferase [Ktedonosporobacter rubrisoli]|uniref:N-acetyltransferase n=1 Tax=Ktedonosporobacter rubrisoli TaxID=2509675 RepID=A0A4P6JW52_KTERU|nr:GNAT family N-acetyltransferase [Ktedonosporobacter rubrisoli]QBD79784.1 N-acetyltransferase [Ktedonosporobacter rubrisoli]